MVHTTLDKIVMAMEHIMEKTSMVTNGEEIKKGILTINLVMELITHMLTTILKVITKAMRTQMAMNQPLVEMNKETTTTNLRTTTTT